MLPTEVAVLGVNRKIVPKYCFKADELDLEPWYFICSVIKTASWVYNLPA